MALRFTLAVGTFAKATSADFSPVFLWSPQAAPADVSPATEHLAAVSGPDVERVAALFAKPTGGTVPEVHLVFLAEYLGTEMVRRHSGRLPALDRLLQNSARTLNMPFTTAHDSELYEHAARVTGAEAEAYLEARASLFTNGASDIIVVLLPAVGAVEAHLASHNALIERVTRAVHASTDGNYAAMLCATHSPAPAQGARRQLSTPPPTAYLHTTPTLLVAQCIVLLLMTIFLGGFCCLFSLQTPKKFADAPPGQN